MSFQLAFHHALEHGVVSGIVLPDSPDPVPEAVIARLHPKEREHALTLKGYRQVSFVGGRLAARAAANQLGVMLGATLPDKRGTPVWTSGLTGSIIHKR
jgi:4'-phosphopantetheinyl transferase EntD